MRRLVTGLCVVALAGCGGGDDDGDGGGGGLSKAEFSAEGKKICDDGAKRTRELVNKEVRNEDFQKMSKEERALHILEKNKPIVDDTMSKIEDLDAPEDVRADVEKLTKGVREVQEIVSGIESPEDARDATARLQELAGETRSAARAAGLEACLPENTA